MENEDREFIPLLDAKIERTLKALNISAQKINTQDNI